MHSIYRVGNVGQISVRGQFRNLNLLVNMFLMEYIFYLFFTEYRKTRKIKMFSRTIKNDEKKRMILILLTETTVLIKNSTSPLSYLPYPNPFPPFRL